MLLQESRRAARTSPTGELVLLEHQDRSLWNREQIAEGMALVQAGAGDAGRWGLIAAGGDCGGACRGGDGGGDGLGADRALYGCAAQMEPSPVVELNRAVAVAMRDGPAAGLELIDAILARRIGGLSPRPFGAGRSVPAAGRTAEARASYERALELARQEPERRFLEGRLR